MDLKEMADALLGAPEPIIVLIDSEGHGMGRLLNGSSPSKVLDVLREQGEGLGWYAVGMMVEGDAIQLNTGEPIGKCVMSFVMSREGAACRYLGADGVSTTVPTEGFIVDAVRAFLA